MSDIGKLLDEYMTARNEARDARKWGSDTECQLADEWAEDARAAIESHVAELRERAEKAEAKLERVREAIERADLVAMNPRHSCIACAVSISGIAGVFREALGEP